MTRRATIYMLTATAASFVATTVAASLYQVLVLGEQFDVATAFAVAVHLAPRGIALAAPAALLFSLGRSHFNRAAFILTASTAAGVLGFLLAFWAAGPISHISAPIAGALLAWTWASVAFILSALSGQPTRDAVGPRNLS